MNAILDSVSAGEMEQVLKTMPGGLSEAIEETLQRIQQQALSRKILGMKALMWISHARRPLLITELADALAINSAERTWNPRNRPIRKLILEYCF